MEDGYSVVNDLSGETKSYVVLANENYMHSEKFVNRFKGFKP